MSKADVDHDVGYCRPPKAHQFKKGISGNPAGRPRKLPPGIPEIVDRFTKERVTFTEGGKKKTATRSEVGLKVLRKQAVAGNLGAAKQILNVLSSASNHGQKRRIRITGGLPE
ncbi:MAG TPA: DUF5681 domain-containing protein [Chthoniobacterales bacterium]|jgi:hypothetical protein